MDIKIIKGSKSITKFGILKIVKKIGTPTLTLIFLKNSISLKNPRIKPIHKNTKKTKKCESFFLLWDQFWSPILESCFLFIFCTCLI